MICLTWHREELGKEGMFSKVYSGTVIGIDGEIIGVEADVSDGLPIFSMVGYLSGEVKEAKERVRIAMKNSGYHMVPKRITVNLSPADVRKEGTAFDLPIAISILAALGIVSDTSLSKTLLIGELSLDGSVMKVNGVLPIVYSAKRNGIKRCIVPSENAIEGATVDGIDVIGVSNLSETVDFLTNRKWIEPTYVDVKSMFINGQNENEVDFCEVVGQHAAKRAIEVAVSGLHNILMIGPPGAGKTMLAKRIPTIMPSLSIEESIEISKIYSISGLLSKEQSLICSRPFRSPHHTITDAALVGGGKTVKPGEISLATGGVLFLDELPEFKKGTIELLRQPLEERTVTIARTHGSYTYPTNFMMCGAMNPCNCGFYPDRNLCNCSEHQVKKYLSKISKPFLDRVDIIIEANKLDHKELRKKGKEESSAAIRERVKEARRIQLERYQKEGINFNAQLTPKMIKTYCALGKEEQDFLTLMFERMGLSARAYHRILKVARTIADLDGMLDITKDHLSEAVCYRSLDEKYWGNNDGAELTKRM